MNICTKNKVSAVIEIASAPTRLGGAVFIGVAIVARMNGKFILCENAVAYGKDNDAIRAAAVCHALGKVANFIDIFVNGLPERCKKFDESLGGITAEGEAFNAREYLSIISNAMSEGRVKILPLNNFASGSNNDCRVAKLGAKLALREASDFKSIHYEEKINEIITDFKEFSQ